MLLLLDVVYQGKAWTCEWLKRYDKEDIKGLKPDLKAGGQLSYQKE